jgi:hypothetical protein
VLAEQSLHASWNLPGARLPLPIGEGRGLDAASTVEKPEPHCWIYAPLDEPKKEIWILKLHPGKRGPTVCSLVHASLAQDPLPKYEALSYTWGPPSDDNTISISVGARSYKLPVRENLYRALRRLRRRRRARWMWLVSMVITIAVYLRQLTCTLGNYRIDALCINQLDNAERSSQVAFMGKIYASAANVDVWLGDCETPGLLSRVKRETELVSTLLKDSITKDSIFKELRRWRHGIPFGIIETTAVLVSHLVHLYGDKINVALDSSGSYWYQRAWTAQEYVLESTVHFYFGSAKAKFSLTRLRLFQSLHVFRALHFPGEAPVLPMFLFSQVWHLEEIKSRFLSTTDQLDFLQISSRLRHAPATDLRDMVYSVRALISDGLAHRITPDYDLPCWKVYANATFAEISHSENLYFLTFAGSVLHTRHIVLALPTWAANFCVDKTMGFIAQDSEDMAVMTPMRSPPLSPQPTVSGDLRRLAISGLRLGSIRAYGTLPTRQPGMTSSALSPAGWHKWLAGHLSSILRQVHRRAFAAQNATADPGPGDFLVVPIHVPSKTNGMFDPSDFLAYAAGKDDLPERLDVEYDSYSLSRFLLLFFDYWKTMIVIHNESAKSLVEDRSKNSNAWDRLSFIRPYVVYASGGILDRQMSFFALSTGLFGLAPGFVHHADIVVFVPETMLPLVLRRCGKFWTFHGFAFMPTIMDGALEAMWEGRELKVEEFILI